MTDDRMDDLSDVEVVDAYIDEAMSLANMFSTMGGTAKTNVVLTALGIAVALQANGDLKKLMQYTTIFTAMAIVANRKIKSGEIAVDDSARQTRN